MNANPHDNAASRHALWILAAPALALAATCVLLLAGGPGDWFRAVWLLAVLWTIGASLAQALRDGFRHGDWSAFACAERPCAAPSPDDDGDFATRTGIYAHLRVRAEHEALLRYGDRCLDDHDRSGPPG